MQKTQLIFDFPTKPKLDCFSEENFIFSQENKNAADFLNAFLSQNSFDTNTFPSFILEGESGCGKTHLLHIFSKKFPLIFLTKEDLINLNITNFFNQNHFYVLENIDEIKNDEMLLHAINSAHESKAFLILTLKNIDEFYLKDLVSRLKNIFTIKIKNPSPEFIKILLSQGLSQRQLKISDEVLLFLSNRLKPSYQAVQDVLRMIEFYCHESKKSFTIAEAKKLL